MQFPMPQRGEQFGPYEILAPIGAGGMGEVYKARDTRLDRLVAIKVSKDQFSERFEREARAVAALNHPNICQLYDVGPNYLVMEFIEGEPLKGPLPLDKAVEYAGQILEALDAAHKKNITHRDLKPANILVTKQGIKLLDFGLAKRTTPLKDTDATLTAALTSEGQIVGTLQYMSPEQLQSKDADARSDIFAFGCVLYELLTGKRAFEGSNAASVIAAIMERPAPSVSDVAPASLDRVLKTCLAKNPDQRWQAALDLKRNLLWAIESEASGKARAAVPWGWIAAAVLLLVAGALSSVHFRERPPEAQVARFQLTMPPGQHLASVTGSPSLSLSADGRLAAFVAASEDGRRRIWLRSLDSVAARPLVGAEGTGVTFGCWSPDSKELAFLEGAKLKRIPVAGGSAIPLADAGTPRGCSWSQSGVIVFAPSNTAGPLYRVPASGGAVTPATTVAGGSNPINHRYPFFLPDGRHFLYSAVQVNAGVEGSNQSAIYVGSLDQPGDSRKLMEADSFAIYSQGYLLFLRGNNLMARPFDPERLAFTGEELAAGEEVRRSLSTTALGALSASQNGWLLYEHGTVGATKWLTWFDRSGKSLGRIGEPGDLSHVALSPDRKRIVVRMGALSGNSDLWIYDVSQGLRTRFTFQSAAYSYPTWSPDGRTIVFISNRSGSSDIYRKPSDGSSDEELLYAGGGKLLTEPSFSPDGKYLVFREDQDLRVLSNPLGKLPVEKPASLGVRDLGGARLSTRFSPDGKWIAYTSGSSGRPELFVAPFPGPGGKRQVSVSGGVVPRWRQDGKELFFLDLAGRVMAAQVNTPGGVFEVGRIEPLFTAAAGSASSTLLWDASPDGQRFVAASAEEDDSEPHLTMVQNWTASLKK